MEHYGTLMHVLYLCMKKGWPIIQALTVLI